MSASVNGFLVVDKPGGITSRDAVDQALRWFPPRTRLGHTGTLDPLATGVLVLAVGAGTRLTEYVQRMEKTYRAGLRLGSTSDTDDADGTVRTVEVDKPPDREAVAKGLQTLIGAIEQVPPAFSAARVSGRRAYDLARRGEKVSLQARRVDVYAVDLIAYSYPKLGLEIRCGKGTYIRALARDLGERLGCGALVESLRRTRVGPFHATDGLSLDAEAPEARARLLPLAAAVSELPRVEVTAAEAARLRTGQALSLAPSLAGNAEALTELAVFSPTGELVAVASADRTKGLLQPEKVFPA